MAGYTWLHLRTPNDVVGGGRALVRGLPIIGDLMDEGFAVLDASTGGDRSKSWSDRWHSAVEAERAYDAAYDKRHPLWSAALQTAGNFAIPGGPALGVAAKVGRLAMKGGRVLSPVIGRAIDGAFKGAIDGAANGLSSHGSLDERAGRAFTHGVRGAVWGATTPLLARGFGKEVADASNLREGARADRRAGILGRLDANGPIVGLLPLPVQAY
jgi:hypothetical protein